MEKKAVSAYQVRPLKSTFKTSRKAAAKAAESWRNVSLQNTQHVQTATGGAGSGG